VFSLEHCFWFKSYTCSYNVEDPTEIAQGLGVPHTIEAVAIWGTHSGASVPASYLTTNKNIIPVVQGYWTSFIRTLDPNKLRASGTPEWTAFNGSARILFETNATRIESVDEAQRERCEFFWGLAEGLSQ
jgi:carboxylesterase type B